jgi:hypothetical protein
LIYHLKQIGRTSKKERWRILKIQISVKMPNESATDTYRVGDLVSKDQNQLQPKLHKPRDGPYTIDKVYTNGTKIRKGIMSEKVSICRVNPYNTLKKTEISKHCKN